MMKWPCSTAMLVYTGGFFHGDFSWGMYCNGMSSWKLIMGDQGPRKNDGESYLHL